MARTSYIRKDDVRLVLGQHV